MKIKSRKSLGQLLDAANRKAATYCGRCPSCYCNGPHKLVTGDDGMRRRHCRNCRLPLNSMTMRRK